MSSARCRYRSAASAATSSLLTTGRVSSIRTRTTFAIASILSTRSSECSLRAPHSVTAMCCSTRGAHIVSSAKAKPQGETRRHIRLSVVRPDLVGEWVPELNDSDVQEVSSNSTTRVWWRCADCDRNYMSSVYDRAVKEKGCPFCAADAAATASPSTPLFSNVNHHPLSAKGESETANDDTRPSTEAHQSDATEAGVADGADASSAAAETPLGRNVKVIMDFNSGLAFRVSESAAGGTMEMTPLGSGKKVRATVLSVDISDSLFQITGTFVDHVRLIRVETDVKDGATDEAQPAHGASFAESYPDLLPYWNFTRNGALSPALTSWDTMQSAWWVAHHSVFPMEEPQVIDFFSEVQPRLRSPLQSAEAAAGSRTVKYFAVCEPLRRSAQSFHRAVYAFVRNPYSWSDQIRAQQVLEETLLSDIERAAHIKEAIQSGQFDPDALPTSVRDSIVQRLGVRNTSDDATSADAQESQPHWNTHIPSKVAVSSKYSVYTNENREFDNGMPKHVMPVAKLVESLNAQIRTAALYTSPSHDGVNASYAAENSSESPSQDLPGASFAPLPSLQGGDVAAAVEMWKSQFCAQSSSMVNEKLKEMDVAASEAVVGIEANSLTKQKYKRFQNAPFERQLIFKESLSQATRNGTLAAYVAFIAQQKAAAGKPLEGLSEFPAVLWDDSEATPNKEKEWLQPFTLTLEDATGANHQSPASPAPNFFDPAAVIAAETATGVDATTKGVSDATAAGTRSAMPPRPEECESGANGRQPSKAPASWSTDQFDYYLDTRNPQVISDEHDGSNARERYDRSEQTDSFAIASRSGDRIVTFVQDAREVDKKHTLARRRPDRRAVEQAVYNTGVSNTFDDEKELDETLSSALAARRHANRRDRYSRDGEEDEVQKVAESEFTDVVADEVEQALQSDDRISLRRRKFAAGPDNGGGDDKAQSGTPLPEEVMRNRQYHRRGPQPRRGEAESAEGAATIGTVLRTGRERRFSLFRPRDEYYIRESPLGDSANGVDGQATHLAQAENRERRADAANQRKRLLSRSLQRATGISSGDSDTSAPVAEDEKQEPMVIPNSPRRVARPRRAKIAEETDSK